MSVIPRPECKLFGITARAKWFASPTNPGKTTKARWMRERRVTVDAALPSLLFERRA